MTDNEIVKALECCIKSSHFGECFKNQCPLVSEKGCKVGKETLYPYLLDLINRLQAENERLKKGWRTDVILTANAKAEAYKECIEKVKENLMFLPLSAMPERFVTESVLDNLLKELVGEDK